MMDEGDAARTADLGHRGHDGCYASGRAGAKASSNRRTTARAFFFRVRESAWSRSVAAERGCEIGTHALGRKEKPSLEVVEHMFEHPTSLKNATG